MTAVKIPKILPDIKGITLGNKTKYVAFRRNDGTIVNFKTRCNPQKSKMCHAVLRKHEMMPKNFASFRDKGHSLRLKKNYGSERY